MKIFKLKNLIKRLPEPLRFWLLRRNLNIVRLKEDDVVFKLATTSEELEKAYALLHNAYVTEGYMKANISGLRCTIYHTMPHSAVLIGKYKDEVVATVTLFKDSPLGLPSDEDYQAQNDLHREQGYHLCEVSSLAIDPKFRSGMMTFHLIKYLWHYATDILDVTLFCCVINPKALDFYKAFLGFQKEGPTIDYEFVEGAKGVYISRDLTQSKDWLRKTFDNAKPQNNLYTFFYEETSPFIYPERSPLLLVPPVFNKSMFEDFFIRKTDVLKNANKDELDVLHSAYSLYFDVPQKKEDENSDLTPRPFRYPSAAPAALYNEERTILGKITDLSIHGLFFHTNKEFDLKSKYHIIFKGNGEIIDLEVEPRWKSPLANKRHMQGYGLRFVNPSDTIEKLLKNLHHNLSNNP